MPGAERNSSARPVITRPTFFEFVGSSRPKTSNNAFQMICIFPLLALGTATASDWNSSTSAFRTLSSRAAASMTAARSSSGWLRNNSSALPTSVSGASLSVQSAMIRATCSWMSSGVASL